MTFKSLLQTTTKAITLFAAVSLLAISCGGGGGSITNKEVTLTIWKPFANEQAMQVLFEEYRKVHPNVQFQIVNSNIDTYETDLLNAFANDAGPDIFSINNTWLPKYQDKVVAAPENLYPYKTYRDSFVDVVIKDFTRDQKVYGVALSVDSLALYYNKDILGTLGIVTPPKTWTELAKDVRLITKQDQTGYFTRSGVAMGTSRNVNRAQDIVSLLMLQAGATPWSNDGLSPQFATSMKNGENAGVKGLSFYVSFANPESNNYTWNDRSDYSIDAFANGRAAFLYSYTYARDQIIAKAPNLNFDVAPVPQENLEDPAVNFANYFGEVVNKKSANANVAWDFLQFATRKEILDKYYAVTKQPSARKDLIALQINDLDIGIFAHANLTAKSFYKPDEAKMNKILNDMIDNIVLQGNSVEDSLDRAQSEASALGKR